MIATTQDGDRNLKILDEKSADGNTFIVADARLQQKFGGEHQQHQFFIDNSKAESEGQNSAMKHARTAKTPLVAPGSFVDNLRSSLQGGAQGPLEQKPFNLMMQQKNYAQFDGQLQHSNEKNNHRRILQTDEESNQQQSPYQLLNQSGRAQQNNRLRTTNTTTHSSIVRAANTSMNVHQNSYNLASPAANNNRYGASAYTNQMNKPAGPGPRRHLEQSIGP